MIHINLIKIIFHLADKIILGSRIKFYLFDPSQSSLNFGAFCTKICHKNVIHDLQIIAHKPLKIKVCGV